MFYANWSILLFAFLFLLIASYSDLKKREISNKLILFFLVYGILYNLIFALVFKNYGLLLTLLYSLLISIIVFITLWKLGVIAGGDTKLFIAISALLPTMQNTLHLFNVGLGKIQFLPIFPIILFVISAFMVLPWILIYSKYLLFKKKHYKDLTNQIISRKNLLLTLDSILVAILVVLVTSLFNFFNVFYILIAFFILAHLIFRIKIKSNFYYVIIGLYLIVLVILFSLNKFNSSLLNTIITTSILVIIYSVFLIYLRFIKEKVLIETKEIAKLKEGDVPIYNYYLIDKKIIIKKPNFITKIKEMANGSYYKDLKVDSSKACGLSKKDITFLKAMYNNRLIDNTIYLKKTVAFTPAALLAFILLIMF